MLGLPGIKKAHQPGDAELFRRDYLGGGRAFSTVMMHKTSNTLRPLNYAGSRFAFDHAYDPRLTAF